MAFKATRWTNTLILFVAEGFGSGRIPFAPGTFGTVVGFGWTWLLLASGNQAVYLAGIFGGFLLSVWIGTRAEAILGRKDPGQIVIDEITAIPACFLFFLPMGGFDQLASLFRQFDWKFLILAFVAFRIFDIIKPWPVKGSQSWPYVGLTVDDFLAAGYVNIILFVFWKLNWL